MTHRELLSARTRTAQVETTSFWITRGGASSCIQAVAQQESNLRLRPVSLAVRGEQPRLTPLLPPTAALGAVLSLPSGLRPLPSKPPLNPNGEFAALCAKTPFPHCCSETAGFPQSQNRGKGGESLSRTVFKRQIWLHIAPSEGTWNGSCGSSPSLTPLQIRDTI